MGTFVPASRRPRVATCPTVTRILVGAGGLPQEVIQKLPSVFPNAAVLGAYGMTEALSSMTYSLVLDYPPRTCTAKVQEGTDSCRQSTAVPSSQAEVHASRNGNQIVGLQCG